MNKFNFVNLIALLVIFFASLFCFQYKTSILEFLKIVINSSLVFLIISLLIFSISIMHKIRYNEVDFGDDLKWKNYKNLISEIVSIVIEPSSFICAFSIIKGLIMDYFFKGEFFLKFSEAEKGFILIASIYFIFQASIEIYSKAKDLIYKAEEIEI